MDTRLLRTFLSNRLGRTTASSETTPETKVLFGSLVIDDSCGARCRVPGYLPDKDLEVKEGPQDNMSSSRTATGLLFVFLAFSFTVFLFTQGDVATVAKNVQGDHLRYRPVDTATIKREHPIPKLLSQSEKVYLRKFRRAKRLRNLEYARKDYKDRYGLDPPNGFDQWHAFRNQHTTDQAPSMVEYDDLMEELLPYRAIHPKVLRARSWMLAQQWNRMLIVKMTPGKNMTWGPQSGTGTPYIEKDTIAFMQHMSTHYDLPDVELPINLSQFGRVTIPYERINEYRAAARKGEYLIGEDDKTEPNLSKPEINLKGTSPGPNNTMMHIYQKTCPPNSPLRMAKINARAGWDYKIDFHRVRNTMDGTTETGGFVSDLKMSVDICQQADMQEIAGWLISPLYDYTTVVNDLFPMLSRAKLGNANDIRVPDGSYSWRDAEWQSNPRYPSIFEEKKDAMIFRGTDTGGTVYNEAWRGMHRHRLLLRANRTSDVSAMEPILVDTEEGAKEVNVPGHVMDTAFSDMGFNDIMYVNASIQKEEMIRLGMLKPEVDFEEFGGYKYIVDVDGHGMSARFKKLLKMDSLVVKSIMCTEWFTNAFVPWYHYVPLNFRFTDLYSLITYFGGFGSVPQVLDKMEAEGKRVEGLTAEGRVTLNKAKKHIEEAEKMITAGKLFTETNLRAVDAEIFLYRFILEWARMQDIGGKGGSLCEFGGCE
ncbi:hypothetical protein PROFUN_05914 [Planoprotostelium fungivorum]|uniref:Glycosyl transferase CAP10 domain-containing protein n=1 Tax=Planoprotostelium fungivorum TaxID=1890364 RepID=A0A2P6N7K8_9EUKA|nr:hypothetical protein PROFUN_05914 [Planoprotostelium fungivorum]